MIEILAHEITENDFVSVYGRDGMHRVSRGPHRNPFSESYYYVNVTLADGTEVSYTDIDRVTVWRP